MSLKRRKSSRKQQNRLPEYFVLEVPARSAADLLGLQPETTALHYRKIRQLIADHLTAIEHEVFAGSVELDESYFGGVRKVKRGRDAAGKVVVFGILKRKNVYTRIVDDTRSGTLMSAIERKIAPDSIVYTDRYRSCNALDVSGFHHHHWINHSEQFGDGKNHINGIENFWSRQSGCCASTTVPQEHIPLVPE